MMDELQETVATLIELDEPEALLRTLRDAALRNAARRKDARWTALAGVLGKAEIQLDLILNAIPAGPDFRPDAPGAKGNSQPQPTGADHADATAAAEAASPSPTTA
jgi:hypothetical protein